MSGEEDATRDLEARSIFDAMAAPAGREAAAARMAALCGAEAVFLLVRDGEVGALCPALGRTLPGGSTWRDLLARCGSPGAHSGQVAYPDRRTTARFAARVAEGGQAALVAVGAHVSEEALPSLGPGTGFPLLAALLAAEAGAEAARARVANADAALTRASALATALDGARAELAGAFATADGLNRELAGLNATLEERVAERTAALAAEMAERGRAEEQLRQSQKMEAVGQLTGGIAHDFNNLLTGITGALDLLQSRAAQGRYGDVDRYVGLAQGAARRAASLTHRLLAFSRRQALDPKPTDANRLVAGMEDLVRRTVGPAVAVEVVAAGGLWSCLVDPHQLENALLNLCINARDAMPNGGRLTVETANRWFDERTAAERGMAAGQYISLCVSDTGTGMPPEVVARAFDPFFTTKPAGQGTGLGLSMIYGFASQSGGQARIYSEPGAGTMVCIYLPRHRGEAGAEPAPTTVAIAARAEAGETVLVVDDDATVRALALDALGDAGYAVVEAADGAAGCAVLRSDARVDLLVTDVGLPGGMNGRQMADTARELRPGLPVLYVTGYAENAVVGSLLEPGDNVLTKPFGVEALVHRVRALLGAAP